MTKYKILGVIVLEEGNHVDPPHGQHCRAIVFPFPVCGSQLEQSMPR